MISSAALLVSPSTCSSATLASSASKPIARSAERPGGCGSAGVANGAGTASKQDANASTASPVGCGGAPEVQLNTPGSPCVAKLPCVAKPTCAAKPPCVAKSPGAANPPCAPSSPGAQHPLCTAPC